MSAESGTLAERLAEIETLTAAMERSGEAALQARALVKAVLDLHAAGLERVLAVAAEQGEPGRALVEALARDGLAGCLLALHDLNPLALEARVAAALDDARPLLAAQGCEVALESLAGGVAQVRLERRTHGHSAGAGELRALVEEALFARAPELEGVEVHALLTAARPDRPEKLVQLHLPQPPAAAGALP